MVGHLRRVLASAPSFGHRADGILRARYAQAPPFNQLTADLLTCSSGGARPRPPRPPGRPRASGKGQGPPGGGGAARRGAPPAPPPLPAASAAGGGPGPAGPAPPPPLRA